MWTVIVILFWLVVKWKILRLFEFKGDIRKFFSLFILWNLTKTINRGFYTRFTNIYNYIDPKNFFLEFGFSWNRKYFFLGFCFDESVADTRSGQTFIQVVLGRRQRKQFYQRIRRPMKLLKAYGGHYFSHWSSKDGIKAWPTPIFCGWCLSLSVTMMF